MRRPLSRTGRFLASALFAVSGGVVSHPANASQNTLIEVSQPMSDDGGYHVQTITYHIMTGSGDPGVEIRYTTKPGPIPIDRGSGYEGTEDANEAHAFGLRVRVEQVPVPKWKREPGGRSYFVDTLSVVLDVSGGVAKMRADKDINGEPHWGSGIYQGRFDELVRMTKQCILLNARRSLPPIRFVRLRVRGESRYMRESGTFRIGSPLRDSNAPPHHR